MWRATKSVAGCRGRKNGVQLVFSGDQGSARPAVWSSRFRCELCDWAWGTLYPVMPHSEWTAQNNGAQAESKLQTNFLVANDRFEAVGWNDEANQPYHNAAKSVREDIKKESTATVNASKLGQFAQYEGGSLSEFDARRFLWTVADSGTNYVKYMTQSLWEKHFQNSFLRRL